MPLRFFGALALGGFCTTVSLAQPVQPQGGPASTVAGWIETVTLPDFDITLDAKLDTGAKSSSIDVQDLVRFRRDGKTWFRFTIKGADGKTATIEQASRRVARIMRAEVDDTRRPIVRLKICLAGHVAETDFTLTDRSGQDFQALIGRKFLASRILVDSGRTHIFPRRCEAGSK